MSIDISQLRKEYTSTGLDHDDLNSNPFLQFEQWFKQACDAELAQPDAMVVSTVDPQGHPTSRTVLLKSFDEKGFVFFSNYHSNKAQHIANNPHVSILFLWTDLERQIQIRGTAEMPTVPSPRRWLLLIRLV